MPAYVQLRGVATDNKSLKMEIKTFCVRKIDIFLSPFIP
jgi:hypothetical protein